MNQKQSDDFDSVVRRLAEEAESVYQAHSWKLMEELLDKKKKKRGFAWWYWPLGALVLAGLFWIGKPYVTSSLTRRNSSYENAVTDGISGNSLGHAIQFTADQIFKNIPLQAVEKDQSTNGLAKSDNITTEGTKVFSSDPSIAAITTGNKKPATDSKSATKPRGAAAKANTFNSSGQNKQGLAHELNANHQNRNSNNPPVTNKSEASSIKPIELSNLTPPSDESISPTTTGSGTEVASNTDRTIHILPIPIKLHDLGNARKLNLKDSQFKPAIPLTTPTHSSFIVGVGFAPEYTAVIKRAAGQLGKTYGFNIGYRINRWTISTGLQRSTKDYNALKEDYEIPVSSYYNNLKVFNIKGDCNILELPVNIHYTLLNTKFFSLRLNAGVSSLRMDQEVYVIDYLHANWKPGHDKYRYTNKNWHWLAAVATGVSIQKSITRHLGVTIDPYYQLPLKGVGDGKVNLKSFGSQVGVFWNIPAVR